MTWTVVSDSGGEVHRVSKPEPSTPSLDHLSIHWLVQHLGDGVVIIDGNSEVLMFNVAAEQMFGYAAHEVVGEDLEILLPEEERGAHRKYVQYSKLGGGRVINQVRDLWGRRKDGSLFPMELNVARIPWHAHKSIKDGETLFVGIFRDISERRQMEARLVDEHIKAERAVHEAKFAEKANEAKTMFLASMSHELRTPLNAIIGFGQLLANGSFGSLNQVQQTYLDHIADSSQHLLGLIDDLLEEARMETDRMTIHPKAIDPVEVIQPSLEIAQVLAQDRNVNILDKTNRQDGYSVLADPVRYRQVLLNLLSNAIKYNISGGEVVLEDDIIDGQYYRLSVTDTGPGIAPEKLTDLFTSFHRLGAETTDIQGSGIGLYLSRRLVQEMNGKIGFSTTLGQGSTFWFDLPLAQGDQENSPPATGQP